MKELPSSASNSEECANIMISQPPPLKSSVITTDPECTRSPVKTRKTVSCSNCRLLMKSRREMRETLIRKQHDHLVKMKELSSNLRSRKAHRNAVVSRLNQKLKRKEKQLELAKQDCRLVGSLKKELQHKEHVPCVITAISRHCGVELNDIPSRNAVEAMTRELGTMAEYQTAKMLCNETNCTLGFDATTREERHVNEIHFSSTNETLCAAIDELPGGTAQDYANHIIDTEDRLALVYSKFNDICFEEVAIRLRGNIANTLTDRCAANHAAIVIVNNTWDCSLNELNCNLHPLDTIATKVQSAMKTHEKTNSVSMKILGFGCLAGDVVVQMSKLRFKNGKGDPKGFCSFLDKNAIPRTLLPRYRGNRLHILFHTCGVLFEHHSSFKEYLTTGPALGGLRRCVQNDFSLPLAIVEMQVLGLMGKLITGPWMLMPLP